jgi:hypothetical protein
MTCADCIHFDECFELRGPCREFKTLEDIRKEIEQLNENFKKTATRTTTSDKAADPQKSLRRGHMDP